MISNDFNLIFSSLVRNIKLKILSKKSAFINSLLFSILSRVICAMYWMTKLRSFRNGEEKKLAS